LGPKNRVPLNPARNSSPKPRRVNVSGWVHNMGMNQNLLFTLWQTNIDPENNPFLVETNLPTPYLAESNCPVRGYHIFFGDAHTFTSSFVYEFETCKGIEVGMMQ
jgi:hypothetical protein